MSLAIRMLAEPVRSIAFGSISGTYAGIGAFFANPIRILLVQNLSDALLMFSLDGLDDHFPVNADSFVLLDVTANKTIDQGAFFAQGTRVYVKEIGTPSTGSVYVSVFYGTTL